MRRFYKEVSIRECTEGFEVLLDEKAIKTPAKKPLLAPTEKLARAVASEWEAQGDKIKPETMSAMQLVTTALDRVTENFDRVADEVAAFGGTDLLCYRADEPDTLVKRQEDCWGPYLVWAEEELGVKLAVTSGIMPIQQDGAALELLRAEVKSLDAFELTALHELTNALGSLVLALAFMNGRADLDTVITASFLDALFQKEQWGEDWEVTEKHDKMRTTLTKTSELLTLLKGC